MTKTKLLLSLDTHVRKTVTERHGQTESNYPPEWEWICERLAELYPIDYEELVKEVYPTAECILQSGSYWICAELDRISSFCTTPQSAWRNAFDNIEKRKK